LKFSKLKNQGSFILNEAMPDLMVAFLGWNSNFEKKVRGAYYYYYFMLILILILIPTTTNTAITTTTTSHTHTYIYVCMR